VQAWQKVMAAYRQVMCHVTCRLTAKNRDQLRNRTLGNRVWATFWSQKISGEAVLHPSQLPPLHHLLYTGAVQTKLVSVVKAPASRNSPLVSTQYMRCGDGRDHGAGREITVRSIYSLPTAGGNSPVNEWVEWCRGDDDSTSSSDIDTLDCCNTTHMHTLAK